MLAVGVGIVTLALTSGPQEAAEVATASGSACSRRSRRSVSSPFRPRSDRRGCGRRRAQGRRRLSLAILVLGARILRGFGPLTLLADPAAWAIGFAGLLGLLVSATAMQRASVVTVTAATVAAEAVAAAMLGLVVCGDRPMAGTSVWDVVGS